eukprot:TRINITY_DN14691_c0_g1_i2.p1 TRINITY_DN14691_c0_g1~~TRINITY_DN14691_c0_g1_i2.p1  ORF type:complete len:869 (+),score=167.41 TRINITY_DN14691_c0_g1_i2:141-2609(+)
MDQSSGNVLLKKLDRIQADLCLLVEIKQQLGVLAELPGQITHMSSLLDDVYAECCMVGCDSGTRSPGSPGPKAAPGLAAGRVRGRSVMFRPGRQSFMADLAPASTAAASSRSSLAAVRSSVGAPGRSVRGSFAASFADVQRGGTRSSRLAVDVPSTPRSADLCASPRPADLAPSVRSESATSMESVPEAKLYVRHSFDVKSDAALSPVLPATAESHEEELAAAAAEQRPGGLSLRRDGSTHERALGYIRRSEHGVVPKYVISPNSRPRKIWDMLIIILTVATGICVPFGLVYSEAGALKSGVTGAVVNTVDAFWILDILANFRTGFYNNEFLVLDPLLIADRYARGWLLVDCIAAVPSILTLSSAPWMLLLKLTRLLRIESYFRRLQVGEKHLGLTVGCKVLISVFILCHLASCGWRLARRSDGMPDASSWTRMYVEDIYWVLMTMSTVGYGDIVPRNTGARLYAVLVMLVAPVFFGSIVSALTHVTQTLFDDEVEKRVQQANRFLDCRRIDKELRERVDHNLRHFLYQEHEVRLDPQLFNMLSPAIQRELTLALLNSTVLQFPLFKDAPHAFIAELAAVHAWVQCLPGDLVAEQEQLVQEVVFLVQGRLVAELGNGSHGRYIDIKPQSEQDPGKDDFPGELTAALQLAALDGWAASSPSFTGPMERTLETGAWFGEGCLLDNGRIYVATVYAVTESELAVLAASEYMKVVANYPRLYRRHQELEAAVTSNKVALDELQYVEQLRAEDARSGGMVSTLRATMKRLTTRGRSMRWHDGSADDDSADGDSEATASQRNSMLSDSTSPTGSNRASTSTAGNGSIS